MRPDLSELRVALYGSGGAPYHHAGLVALWGGDPVPLRADAIRNGALDGFDAIVFPGGGMRAMAGMLDPLGVEGAVAIRRWVAEGGMYLGSCAGSFLPAAVGDGTASSRASPRPASAPSMSS
jgi:glutamine amidotransferase PdxT